MSETPLWWNLRDPAALLSDPEAAAIRVRNRVFPNGATMPLDLNAFCGVAGIDFDVVDFREGVSGYLRVTHEPKPLAFLAIARGDSRPRRRFSAAALLFHLFADGPGDYSRETGVRTPQEANDFAAELLMPFEIIEKGVGLKRRTSPEEFAKAFNVTTKAMEIRLENTMPRVIERARSRAAPPPPPPKTPPPPAQKTPWEILGVAPGAPLEEVKRAYMEGVAKNHPDKVSHMDDAIRQFAEHRTTQLNVAYERITQHYQSAPST